MWSIIAALPNLITLNVFLEDPGESEWGGHQCLCVPPTDSDVLLPLRKVKQKLKVFEMSVPWVDTSSWLSMENSQPDLEGVGFKLIKRGIKELRYKR
jgi:hypothetical protein